LSPSLLPESDEEYVARHDDEDMDRTAHIRHWEEDLIWRNHLEMEERNLNQRASKLDIHEAHLRRRERRCDRCEADLHAARLRGTTRGRGHSKV
jgi:hypothetical protein